MLIAFSGLDAAGKSTQIEILLDRLRAQGKRPIYLWTRGGYTPAMEKLKALLRRAPGQALPPAGHTPQREQAMGKPWVRRTWLVLALLDLLWVYGVRVRAWHLCGRTVVCDRYLWDTLVDFRLNFPGETVERWGLWRLLVSVAPRPDAAFLLLVPVQESLRRSDVKGEPFRDAPEVLARRLAHYRSLAEKGYWHTMDGQRSISELAEETRAIVDGQAAGGGTPHPASLTTSERKASTHAH